MDFALPVELTQRLAELDGFIEREIRPLQEQDDNERFFDHRREYSRTDFENGGVPRREWEELLGEMFRRADAAGWLRYALPEEIGGSDGTNLDMAVIREHLAHKGLGLHNDLQNEHSVVGNNVGLLLMLEYGTPEQKAEWVDDLALGRRGFAFGLTEPDHGSDATHMETHAERDGDEWVINGEKTFITGGNDADFVMVFAVTDKDKGADGGVTCFLADRDMGWKSEHIDTMGEWGPASLIFDNVRVPHENMLGEEGQGFALAMRWIGRGRYLLPARALGGCERLVEMGMEHARNRQTFGQPIAERQAIQWMVADSVAELEAARYATLLAAWTADQDDGTQIATSAIAKLKVARYANDIADRALQIHGGMGYSQELPIQLWARDLRVLRIYEGSDEIQRRTLANQVFTGRYRLGGHLA
ncbi:MAG: acyl-CoA dehydrogenase family protein [Actinomycetes bacterium]